MTQLTVARNQKVEVSAILYIKSSCALLSVSPCLSLIWLLGDNGLCSTVQNCSVSTTVVLLGIQLMNI